MHNIQHYVGNAYILATLRPVSIIWALSEPKMNRNMPVISWKTLYHCYTNALSIPGPSIGHGMRTVLFARV